MNDIDNIVIYHLHTENSLLDSCTNYKLYVDKAKEYNQPAICFTEHGNILNWVEKKMYCEEKGVRYLHGIEIYLTKTFDEKVRDNFHTILIAKNYEGVKEINSLIELSSREGYKYYNDRISFDEFFNLSDNIIKISACISSPLNRVDENDEIFEKLINTYDYLEVQPHINFEEQKVYNKKLESWSKKYNIPLICGTDTHSLNDYKSECRKILLKAKRKSYGDEETFDLNFKNRAEVLEMFRLQDSISEESYIAAINNTVIMANSVEDFELDIEFKYPQLYQDQDVKQIFWDRIVNMYNDKLSKEIIDNNPEYMKRINEEFEVFEKLDMISFMLFMSELMCWCWENDIPSSPCRGSVGGSTIAYICDITDVNPIVWGTVFSRFANESRKEIGDIDVDFAPSDREKVYEYIIDRFGLEYTAYIMTTGTCAEKGTIDEICRGLEIDLKTAEKIKSEYERDKDKTREKYPEVFYYFDGLVNTVVSKGVHPAAIIISPITLSDHYGVYHYDGKLVISINMEEVHEVSLVKYDILGLKNVGVIKDCCKLAKIKYPKSHEIDWNDRNVWNDISKSNIGIFQFESAYAGDCLRKFNVQKINDMSLVNAALRPSGASYRDSLLAKVINRNPSKIIDDMLKDNYGYLCFQEDTIKFLQDICGLSGGEADNIRRAIGRKDQARLQKALPQILEGYCSKSDKDREKSEKEANIFLKIIEDSSNYQFGYNHSTGYSMLGYMCAFMRFYYPLQFCTALLLNAKEERDIIDGTELAKLLKVKINPIKFRYSKGQYFPDIENKIIYKGIASVKFCNNAIGEYLYSIRNLKFETFVDLLDNIMNNGVDNRQLDILTKLDFFSEFGNSNELLRIIDMFNFFKQGKAKQISKDKTEDDIVKKIIERYSNPTDDTKKKYILNNVHGCMRECENYIKSLKLEDISFKDKCEFYMQFLGYIDIQTNKPEDRFRLLVLDIQKLKTKAKDKVWAYKVKTKSIGTGKQAELTIYSKVYESNMFDKLDIIQIERRFLQEREYNGYINWYLNNYVIE